MEEIVEQEDAPEAFLEALGKHLKRQEGIDTDLADILEKHLLKVTPTQDAVAQAKDAILRLAGKRTLPPKPDDVND